MRYKSDELVEKAKRLREEGLSYQAIAREVGVKKGQTVKYWLDPIAREQEKARNSVYYTNNKEAANKRVRKSYKKHREKRCEESRAWYHSHKEYYSEKRQQWRQNNQERDKEYRVQYDAAHKEEKSVRSKQYEKDHKDERNARLRLRKAKIDVYDKISQPEYDNLFNSQNGFCAYCGKKMLTDGNPYGPNFYNLEHVYPVSRGGKHTLDNLVYSCHKCNMEKGTKTIKEWRPELLPIIGNGINSEDDTNFINLIQKTTILLNKIIENKESQLIMG